MIFIVRITNGSTAPHCSHLRFFGAPDKQTLPARPLGTQGEVANGALDRVLQWQSAQQSLDASDQCLSHIENCYTVVHRLVADDEKHASTICMIS